MKGLILAGGTGSRIRPFSSYTAKQLLPVLNKPVLFHNLDLLLAGGIKKIGIIVGPMKKFVIAALEKSEYMQKAEISYIDQPEPQGLAHAVKMSRNFLEEDSFIMVLGDNFFSLNTLELIKQFNESEAAALTALIKVQEPQRYGIAEIMEDKITKVIEKPDSPTSNWALAGLYVFTSKIHEIIENLEPSFRNEYEITDAIQVLIKQKQKIVPYFLQGYWRDIGTLFDLWETNMDLLLAENCQQKNEIIEPVLIDPTSRIYSSKIGPKVVIGPNSLVFNSHIENTLVLENSKVINTAGKNMIYSPWGNKEVSSND